MSTVYKKSNENNLYVKCKKMMEIITEILHCQQNANK